VITIFTLLNEQYYEYFGVNLIYKMHSVVFNRELASFLILLWSTGISRLHENLHTQKHNLLHNKVLKLYAKY
jgi:hypothetical protein